MNDSTLPPAGPPQTPPPGYYPVRQSKSTMILVMGIIGLVCCNLLGPIAWAMGNGELRAIHEGHLPPQNEGTAKAGMILGIIGTVLLVISVFWVFFFGGLAMLASLAERSHL